MDISGWERKRHSEREKKEAGEMKRWRGQISRQLSEHLYYPLSLSLPASPHLLYLCVLSASLWDQISCSPQRFFKLLWQSYLKHQHKLPRPRPLNFSFRHRSFSLFILDTDQNFGRRWTFGLSTCPRGLKSHYQSNTRVCVCVCKGEGAKRWGSRRSA